MFRKISNEFKKHPLRISAEVAAVAGSILVGEYLGVELHQAKNGLEQVAIDSGVMSVAYGVIASVNFVNDVVTEFRSKEG